LLVKAAVGARLRVKLHLGSESRRRDQSAAGQNFIPAYRPAKFASPAGHLRAAGVQLVNPVLKIAIGAVNRSQSHAEEDRPAVRRPLEIALQRLIVSQLT